MDLTVAMPDGWLRRCSRPFLPALGLLLATGLLAGCGNNTVQELAGVSRDGPDEFQVVRRAPLTMPPDFNLRPPREEIAERQAATSPSAGTRQLLVGDAARPEEQMSGAETALLARSPVQSEPDIRQVIAREDAQLSTLEDKKILFVLDFQRELYQPNPDVLDPKVEAERLAARSSNNIIVERVGSVPIDQLDQPAGEAS